MEINENSVQPQSTITTIRQTKSNRVLVIILSILLLGAIAVSAYFYFQVQSLKQELANNNTLTSGVLPTLTPTPSSSTNSPITVFTNKYEFGKNIEAEFNKTASEYEGKIITDSKSDVWWISNDNLNIINNDETSLSYQNYNCESDLTNKKMFNSVSGKLSENIKLIMTSSGFSLNQKNSSKSITDDQFYDYVQAYEKGDTKCTFTANPDCGGSSNEVSMHYNFTFTCTNSFDKNYQEQAPYLKGLKITNAVIHVEKKVGDYAFINVNNRRSGHYVIAQLINGAWTEISSGQDVPNCETMQEHQVPKEIYGDCYSL